MDRVVTLDRAEPEGLGKEIHQHLGTRQGEPLLLIEGEDFVLVKRGKTASARDRFEKLSRATRERFEESAIGPEIVDEAIRWSRGSS